MKILFLQGWQSTPGGIKPTFLNFHGHTVLNPALPDDDFDAAVRIAQAEFDRGKPDVVVGSSRGGAVAMNITTDTPLVLLCPAWKRWGTATTVKPGTVVLHSPADETIPFAESQELVRNSGLPSDSLIEVGTEHRLADDESLKKMLEAVNLSIPTLCIGVDVAWWGGSAKHRVSQRDTVVYATISWDGSSDLNFEVVDLSRRPNARCAEPTEPNFDASGELLAEALSNIVEEHRGHCRRCVVALDTPLEARIRPNQPPRVKAAVKGAATGAERRQCERELDAFKATLPGKSTWHNDLRIQSGSPVPSRISRLVQRLVQADAFKPWGQDRSSHPHQIIEIFPSEAIWWLGVSELYRGLLPAEVRAYKQHSCKIAVQEAKEQAIRPLSGFKSVLERQTMPVSQWIEQIAGYACNVACDGQTGVVSKGKGFDDPIESGIACLTAIAFALGEYHVWGDGTDGTIVGPGGRRVARPEVIRGSLDTVEMDGTKGQLVDVVVHYLEMRAPLHQSIPMPRDGLTILHAQRPSVPYYRSLYDAVGKEYHWLSRRKLSDEELTAIIQDPLNELHVLHVDGSPAGFAEVDRRQPDEIEMVQFGLTGDFIGQGLGPWFLRQIIERVWSYGPKRFWLHTCTLDHPAALPMYKKAGFVEYKQEAIRREL